VAQIFRLLFRNQIYVLFFTKMGWATFWAIASQTHLVALLASVFEKKSFHLGLLKA
jgi:hypothetical protein